MKSRMLAVLSAAVLAASLLSGPAQAAPAIPDDPNIVDLARDANGANDQGLGLGVGDQDGLPYFGGADFLEIWFSSTATELLVHVHTTGNPEGGNFAYMYRVWVNDDCQTLEANFTGATNAPRAESTSQIREWCGDDPSIPGELVTEELDDETFLTTLTFPLGENPAIDTGRSLLAPYANSRMVNPALLVPVLDTTPVGTDYEIVPGGGPASSGSDEEPAEEEDPDAGDEEQEEEPEEDEGSGSSDCSDLTGKEKKRCEWRQRIGKGGGGGPDCAPYEPGEMGAEAETVLVTDEHTAEAPLEITMEHGVGAVEIASDRYANVQVETEEDEVGLYVSYEFPVYEDHDLYVYYPNGTRAAAVGGFNATPYGPFDGTGEGGHSEMGAEVLDGLRTGRCEGWTLEFHNFLGEGGEYTAKLWLDEIQNDPAPPA